VYGVVARGKCTPPKTAGKVPLKPNRGAQDRVYGMVMGIHLERCGGLLKLDIGDTITGNSFLMVMQEGYYGM